MGDSFHSNGMGRRQSFSDKHFVPGYSNWTSNIITKRPRSKIETMKQIADITFHTLGFGYVAAGIITKVDGVLNTASLVILVIYFGFRSYFKLRREHIAMRKEMFEQMQREKDFYKQQ